MPYMVPPCGLISVAYPSRAHLGAPDTHERRKTRMPLYTFRLPAAFSSTPVTVYNTADAQQATGTTDANAVFTATLPTGDYYAKVSYGYRSYRAAGEVDRGDLDNVSEAALSATYAPL